MTHPCGSYARNDTTAWQALHTGQAPKMPTTPASQQLMNTLNPVHSPRSSLAVLGDVTFGLLMRELKTRFGNYRMGYAWALIDPLIMLGVFCVIFGLRARTSFGGVEAPVFIISGYLPFLLFNKVANQVKAAVSANMALFCYRQVTPFATMLTRYLLEVLIFLMVLIVISLILIWFGFHPIPADFLPVFAASFLLSLFAFAIGMLLCVINRYSPEVGKFFSYLMMPLMFLSGVMIPISVVPMPYQGWLLWNPILHAIELIRSGWIAGFSTPYASWSYLAGCTLIALVLAMSSYRLNRYRLIGS